ncbi:MAG: hypothetical protein F6K23_15040 [Okeania sp. SIO2C9]|uniref:hypothetical protein n=1 Tax=Okeania sp. SIO2C9 TaxID=2607791 RepID=UPI0013C1C34C|nr:hypothetical protein [Okeania sp. SIO2C9]NEQ74236.1 hypothetical protein [Okeania sp. SIO2C9]
MGRANTIRPYRWGGRIPFAPTDGEGECHLPLQMGSNLIFYVSPDLKIITIQQRQLSKLSKNELNQQTIFQN